MKFEFDLGQLQFSCLASKTEVALWTCGLSVIFGQYKYSNQLPRRTFIEFQFLQWNLHLEVSLAKKRRKKS